MRAGNAQGRKLLSQFTERCARQAFGDLHESHCRIRRQNDFRLALPCATRATTRHILGRVPAPPTSQHKTQQRDKIASWRPLWLRRPSVNKDKVHVLAATHTFRTDGRLAGGSTGRIVSVAEALVRVANAPCSLARSCRIGHIRTIWPSQASCTESARWQPGRCAAATISDSVVGAANGHITRGVHDSGDGHPVGGSAAAGGRPAVARSPAVGRCRICGVGRVRRPAHHRGRSAPDARRRRPRPAPRPARTAAATAKV